MARGIEAKIDTGSPILPEAILGKRRMYHHFTIGSSWGSTYGGLYEDRDEACEAKKALAKLDQKFGAVARWIMWKLDMSVSKLQENEEYRPYGAGGITFIHGVNDGTHGSSIREEHKYLTFLLDSYTSWSSYRGHK